VLIDARSGPGAAGELVGYQKTEPARHRHTTCCQGLIGASLVA
jgi:hypothetical protein